MLALSQIKDLPNTSKQKFVILTDAKSVLQALNNAKDQNFPTLNGLLAEATNCTTRLILQWIPGHCKIKGNDEADRLAKEGSAMVQIEVDMSLAEVKTQIKAEIQTRWLKNHPQFSNNDPFHNLHRDEQTILFRLRTGHNRLKKHMHSKFKIGDSPNCPCGPSLQTTEHILQDCPTYTLLRQQIWPHPTTYHDKLFGTLKDLTLTVEFIKATNLQI